MKKKIRFYVTLIIHDLEIGGQRINEMILSSTLLPEGRSCLSVGENSIPIEINEHQITLCVDQVKGSLFDMNILPLGPESCLADLDVESIPSITISPSQEMVKKREAVFFMDGPDNTYITIVGSTAKPRPQSLDAVVKKFLSSFFKIELTKD